MRASNQIISITIILFISWTCTALSSHEFWIEPEKFLVDGDEKIIADLRVGEMMRGVSYGYYPRNFKRLDLKTKNILKPILGRIGDKPAVSIAPQGNTLVTLIYSTTESEVTYNNWQQFETFLNEKNLNEAKDYHLRNNFPKTKFKEIYSRHAKSLIGSGSSVGNDQAIGLEFEIVLDENPYVKNLGNELTVSLFYKQKPRPNTQIEIFSRTDNQKVIRTTRFTNKLGKAKISVVPKTDYLINSVLIRQPDPELPYKRNSKQPILWESLWASSTFNVP